MPFHPLPNIEINEYYKNEPRFNGVYSRNNLPKIIKKGAYIIKLDEYANICTHWIALFVKPKYTVYFDSFSVEHIPKEIKKFIGNKDIKVNIFRLQAYDSIMCGYFCIEFINYMFKGKTLLEYTNLFSPNDFKKNGQIIKSIANISQYFPPYGSTNNIKIELDLANYATKDDVKNVTHVDVSSYATKTNLAALKSEVDKIDTNKLKTVPTDLSKLSNVVKNDVVKKTDYDTKVTSIETKIAGLTKNTLDNLADIAKLNAVDTNNFVLKTELTSDVNTLNNK